MGNEGIVTDIDVVFEKVVGSVAPISSRCADRSDDVEHNGRITLNVADITAMGYTHLIVGNHV